MSLIAKEDGDSVERKQVPEDTHHGVCIGVIELGTIFDERYGKSKREVLFTWELPYERIEIQRDDSTIEMPMVISNKYTISLHEKANLRKMIQSWLGRKLTFEETQGFDLKELLNRNAMVQVVHWTNEIAGKTYANVNNVLPLIKGIQPRTAEHAPVYFDLDDLQSEDDLPDVPEWILNRIKESDEWRNFINPQAPQTESDIPF